MSIVTIDQAGDKSHQELVKYSQLYELPEIVKTAQLDSLCQPPRKAANFYADAREPFQFPCHSPAATIVSHLFFLNKAAELNPKIRPLIETRLNQFAQHWNVQGAVHKLAQQHTRLCQDPEVPDSAYALVQTMGGTKYREYPLRNPLETKAAAQWFHDFLPQLREQYPFYDRQKIAAKILRKSEEFGVKLAEETERTLEKSAGHGLNPPQDIAMALRHRVKAGRKVDADAAAALTKIAELVTSRPKAFLEPGTTSELAHSLDQFDRTYGLLNKYSELLPSPEDTVFGVTFKQANAAVQAACTTLTGAIYDKNDFAKLSRSDVAEAFGDEIAHQVARGLRVDPSKMAEFVATLPLPDARMFDDLMSSKQVRPLAKEARHYGLTPDEYATIVAVT